MIKRNSWKLLVCIAVLIFGFTIPCLTSAQVFDVRQNFPKNNQGDNGIFLQYRNVSSSNYVDLNNYNPFGEPKPVNPNDYIFVTPDRTDSDHYPVILGYPYNNPVPSLNQISAAPSCTPRNNNNADAIIRITIPGRGGRVRISGSCNHDLITGNVSFTIYKGAGNYNSPIWSASNSGNIDIAINYREGEQLFFATNTGGDGCPDLSYWTDLKLDVNTKTNIGTFRPSIGNWYLDNTMTGIVNKTFHFGTTGDIPVVGDWDGDGISDAGVFRPSIGNWYLDYNSDGVKDKEFHFGMKGDTPIVGDWDGDGISDIGVFRLSNGNWYFDTTKTGIVNKTFHFGTTGDLPQVGKWI